MSRVKVESRELSDGQEIVLKVSAAVMLLLVLFAISIIQTMRINAVAVSGTESSEQLR